MTMVESTAHQQEVEFNVLTPFHFTLVTEPWIHFQQQNKYMSLQHA